jgi:2-methylcitrate dehydratase PrpD
VQTAIPDSAPHAAGLTADLARFIAASPRTPLSTSVQHAACRAFVNWLGCALGAVDDGLLEPVLRVAQRLGSSAQASIVGRAEQLDPVNAALVNGVSANVLDYDDMHVRTLIHPSGPVAAAALAVAEDAHASGAALLSAVATGIEIECRLGLALFPAHYDQGWHITATMGTLGAAAAASAILKLDANRTAMALGIAATQAGGLRAMLPNACKSFNIGRAAAGGVLAAMLAQAGLESAPDVLETKFGLFDVLGWPSDPAAITRDLGARYLVSELSLKPYPCGVVIHPLIDACLEISQQHALDRGQLRAVNIYVHPRAVELAGRKHPVDAIAGRFSLYHAAALALARRSAGLAAFDGADVNDPELAALRDLMVVKADARLLPSQARIDVDLIDGTHFHNAVEHPSGSPEPPLTDAQLHDKFIELARRVLDENAAEALFSASLTLDRLADVAELRRYWVA